jgi:DNA (cytosine-5)-methyltransferase 1
VDNTKEFRLLSICTGYGGIEHGLSLAGFKHRVKAFLEVEAFCCANLVKAMEVGAIRPAPIWTDLKTFNAQPFRGLVDIIVGGYPCQPFSNSGKRSGVEDERHLWPFIKEIVRTVRPIWVFFENVEGHVTLGLREVLEDLRGMGYIVEVGLFSSEETGASHTRKRVFILGQLGNSESTECNVSKYSWRGRGGFANASEFELANTNGSYDRYNKGEIQSQAEEVKRKTRQQHGERLWREFETSSDKLANTGGVREGKMEQKTESELINRDGFRGRFPIARPGELQYEWEEPRANTKRALKSRLGLSADGYDYRTDFLRALGNGVDPWVAKLAFEILMDKIQK